MVLWSGNYIDDHCAITCRCNELHPRSSFAIQHFNQPDFAMPIIRQHDKKSAFPLVKRLFWRRQPATVSGRASALLNDFELPGLLPYICPPLKEPRDRLATTRTLA